MDQQTNDTIGKVLLGFLGTAFAWKALGPVRREKFFGFLEELAVLQQRQAWLRAQEEAALPQRAPASPTFEAPSAELRQVLQSLLAPVGGPVDTPRLPVPQLESDARWREALVPPAVALILGKRGSGKSALAYRLLELFRHRLTPLVVGPPQRARTLLPEWIGIATSLEDLPQNCIALIDEAYLAFHARESHTDTSKAMSQLLNLSRQRNQTLLFVTQEARQVDRNIVSAASVVVFKELGLLQLEFERPELRKLVEQAREALASRAAGVRRQWSYVYSPDADFLGLLPGELPSFWKPSLSQLFAGDQTPAVGRPGVTLGREERIQKARELRQQGFSHQQIAGRLGVSKATVINYVKGYPYQAKRG